MAYTFTNTPFQWTKAGTDPTDAEITLGFQGGMALPAAFLNQQWSKTYASIAEIQTFIEDGTIYDNVSSLSVGVLNTVAAQSLAVGNMNTVSGASAYAAGSVNVINGNDGFALGSNLIANQLNVVVGKYNKEPTAADVSLTTGDVFVVGNGQQGDAGRSNAFRVTAAGQCMGTTFFASSGADYAELFEWLDSNPGAEDRRGLFVTLDGEKIRLATAEDDYILGAISATPTVIGDAATEDWHGKYERDVFGDRVVQNGTYRLSETFDESKDNNYTSRLNRPEWGIVGLTGKLIIVDDGTCQVNGYCYPKEGGVATAAEKGYRVMSRIDDTHIRVLVK